MWAVCSLVTLMHKISPHFARCLTVWGSQFIIPSEHNGIFPNANPLAFSGNDIRSIGGMSKLQFRSERFLNLLLLVIPQWSLPRQTGPKVGSSMKGQQGVWVGIVFTLFGTGSKLCRTFKFVAAMAQDWSPCCHNLPLNIMRVHACCKV